MPDSVYLLPERGGSLDRGLGEELSARGFRVIGRELRGDFGKLAFGEQVETVADDLRSGFWTGCARVVANSFGAYLFLQAQALSEPFPGKALLLSPIVGEAQDGEHMAFFVPPRAGRLRELIHSGRYPAPADCEAHVGKLDWQGAPEKVAEFGKLAGISVTVVPGAGHALPKEYVSAVLDRWLGAPNSPAQGNDTAI